MTKNNMSKRLQQYVSLFGHIVGTEFSNDKLAEMEIVAAAYSESFNKSFDEGSRINREKH